MTRSRAPDITDELVQQVLDTLDSWKGKLTWALLLDAIEESTGHRYSRYTFPGYPQIANAFDLRKESTRSTVRPSRGEPSDERVRAALAQAARYDAKAQRLQAENDLLLEQFVTWASNAERKGVTIDMLNAPLPKPSRDQSKGVK